MKTKIPEITNNSTAVDILRHGLEAAGGPVSLACSFSLEDVAIIDIAHKAGISLRVFALDTGRLPEETYEVAEALTERYRLKIDWYFPRHDAVEALEREKGLFSFRESPENRHECCAIRKVEPLSRALAVLSGWVTGIRRDQTPERAGARIIEWDGRFGLEKVNPLAAWTSAQVEKALARGGVPVNPLHARGYLSIGCAPCTSPVRPGEDPRAGRWRGSEKKECGLHWPRKPSGG